MKTIYKIAKTELRNIFYSPIAWLILIIFTFQCGMAFSGIISNLVRNQTMGYGNGNITLGMFGGWSGIFPIVQSYLYLYMPLLTMGLMSREFGSGSIKLLYSSPVTNSQIILGKYLSMMIYGLALMGVLVVYSLIAILTVENVDIPVILSGLLGIYFIICAYSAIGLFMSSITSYQIVAAVGTLAILAALTYVKGIWQSVDFVRDITYWFSITGRADEFINGMITSEDFLYFLIVIALFISMTIIRLQSRRMVMSFASLLGRYAFVWLIAIALGYVSSRPIFMTYADVTHTKQNTLTPNSQGVLKRLDGGLTITSYTNILDKYFWVALPNRINEDFRTFKQYVRFKPEIKMKYVYYYDSISNPSLERGFPGLTDEERAKKIIEINDLNPKKILSPEQIRKQIDLKSEGNRFVRLIEREDGQKTFLRIFDDNAIFPYEAEISAALKRMVMKLPKVGFLSGQGERSADDDGEREYSIFTKMKTFRHSLINQGFDFTTVGLDNDIPEDISILVIADMKNKLNAVEKSNFDKYINRGGNLMILGEPNRAEITNSITEQLGVKLLNGALVTNTKAFPADMIISVPTEQAKEYSYMWDRMRSYNYVATTPSVAGLEYSSDKGFKVTPLFDTDTLKCWNELETTDFVEGEVKYNPQKGEIQKKHTTAVALNRKVNGKEQNIIIFGDADCISNGEITRSRTGVFASNYFIIQGAFFKLSNEEVPFDIRRPSPPDRKLNLKENGAYWLKIMLMGILPGILLIVYILIWIRRRSR